MEDKNLGETSSPLALMNEHGVISIRIRHTGIRWEGRVVVGIATSELLQNCTSFWKPPCFFVSFQHIVCTMGLKWYPHPEVLHCIKGCEVRKSKSSQMALYPESSLPHWRHSCLDLHLQRPKKIHEDEDVEELYTKVSICTSDCDVQRSFFLCFPSVLVDHLVQSVCSTDLYKCLSNSHLHRTCSFLIRQDLPMKRFLLEGGHYLIEAHFYYSLNVDLFISILSFSIT